MRRNKTSRERFVASATRCSELLILDVDETETASVLKFPVFPDDTAGALRRERDRGDDSAAA